MPENLTERGIYNECGFVPILSISKFACVFLFVFFMQALGNLITGDKFMICLFIYFCLERYIGCEY